MYAFRAIRVDHQLFCLSRLIIQAFIHVGQIVSRLPDTSLTHFLNCSMLFTDNLSQSLIWKHNRECGQRQGTCHKGFLG